MVEVEDGDFCDQTVRKNKKCIEADADPGSTSIRCRCPSSLGRTSRRRRKGPNLQGLETPPTAPGNTFDDRCGSGGNHMSGTIIGSSGTESWRQLATEVCTGADHLGWLSGVALDHPNLYNNAAAQPGGTVPTVSDGVVQRVACIQDYHQSRSYECGFTKQINIVKCDDFILWQLPKSAGIGYCLN